MSVYPLTVLAARYGGTYEGAKYVAFNDKPGVVVSALGDDIMCAAFFDTYERLKPIGRGATPQEASEDLRRKVDGFPEEDFRHPALSMIQERKYDYESDPSRLQ